MARRFIKQQQTTKQKNTTNNKQSLWVGWQKLMALRFSGFSGQVVLALWIRRGAAKIHPQTTEEGLATTIILQITLPKLNVTWHWTIIRRPRVPGWLQETGLVETIANVNVFHVHHSVPIFCCTNLPINTSVQRGLTSSGKERDEQPCSYALTLESGPGVNFSSAATRCVTWPTCCDFLVFSFPTS